MRAANYRNAMPASLPRRATVKRQSIADRRSPLQHQSQCTASRPHSYGTAKPSTFPAVRLSEVAHRRSRGRSGPASFCRQHTPAPPKQVFRRVRLRIRAPVDQPLMTAFCVSSVSMFAHACCPQALQAPCGDQMTDALVGFTGNPRQYGVSGPDSIPLISRRLRVVRVLFQNHIKCSPAKQAAFIPRHCGLTSTMPPRAANRSGSHPPHALTEALASSCSALAFGCSGVCRDSHVSLSSNTASSENVYGQSANPDVAPSRLAVIRDKRSALPIICARPYATSRQSSP